MKPFATYAVYPLMAILITRTTMIALTRIVMMMSSMNVTASACPFMPNAVKDVTIMASEKELLERLLSRWSGACSDSSGSELYAVKDGKFHLTVAPSNASIANTITRLSGVPSDAQQSGLTWSWDSVADTIFGERLVKAGYDLRQPQLHMARMIQRSAEMRQHAVVEAATGTGKSYAYLYVAMELGLKIIVSTSNKALQSQLVNKDVPAVLASYPGKTFALRLGKKNYACVAKVNEVKPTGQLAAWLAETQTGNTEDIDFPIDYKQLSAIQADDSCTGKRCDMYGKCHYYQEKSLCQNADIVVCNHALLALHTANPEFGILPEADMIIVDEAHKLADYVRAAHSNEVKSSSTQYHIDIVKRSNIPYIDLMQIDDTFASEIKRRVESANPCTIKADESFDSGIALSKAMIECADIIFPPGDSPVNAESLQEWRKANSLRQFARKLIAVSLPTKPGHVRWIESNQDAVVITDAPWDIAGIMGNVLYPPSVESLSRAFCSKCGGELGDDVGVIAGRGFCLTCVGEHDTLGDAEIMPFGSYINQPEQKPKTTGTPYVFCSATLATPTLEGFCKSLGIGASLQTVAPSPFDYANNSVLYIPNGTAPPPNDKSWSEFIADDMRRLVLGSKGGAFLLFTSYKMMRDTSDAIGSVLASAGLNVLVQGKNTKGQIVGEFKSKSNCVLFATKSFWEGIDIRGDNLRLIYIDKIPFSPPHPITEAIKSAGKGDWFTVDLPAAITDLKQGVGRLIRTSTDRGVIAIGDTRIRTAQYGRSRILPSLPPSKLVHDYWQALDFFRGMQEDRKLTPIEIFGVERDLLKSEEIPF